MRALGHIVDPLEFDFGRERTMEEEMRPIHGISALRNAQSVMPFTECVSRVRRIQAIEQARTKRLW